MDTYREPIVRTIYSLEGKQNINYNGGKGMVFQRRKINRNNKDVLFGLTFQNKKDLLQLYNAVNETNYTDEQQLEITTLGDAVYMA